MEHVLALEIWAASLAFAGALGWIIGDMRRTGRADTDPGDGGSLADAEHEGLFTLTVPPMHAVVATVRENDRCNRAAPLPPSRSRSWSGTAELDPPCSDLRSEIFATMPPIAELEVQTRAFRQQNPVWQSPQLGEHLAEFMRTADLGSLEVLNHYRSAIAQLSAGGDAGEVARPAPERRTRLPDPVSEQARRREMSPSIDAGETSPATQQLSGRQMVQYASR